VNPSNFNYVDSWQTLLGGRMLGHHIAYRPSRQSNDYGDLGGVTDYLITSTGEVFEPSLLAGVPGWRLVTIHYVAKTKKRPNAPIFDKGRVDQLNALVIGSSSDLEDAIRKADAAWAKRQATTTATVPATATTATTPVVAPVIVAQTGQELIAAQAAAETARIAAASSTAPAAAAAPAKKKKKAKKKGIPVWAWIAGGIGLVVLLGGTAFAVSRRRRAMAQLTGA
jgi:hypothetical protein